MSSNALALYAKAVASVIPNTSEAQGEAIALTCMVDGIHPIDFARRYHWIPGKGPSMRSDAMTAEFKLNHGGDYECLEKTARRAAIKFTTAAGKAYTFELTRRD